MGIVKAEEKEMISLCIGDRFMVLWPGRILQVEQGLKAFYYPFGERIMIFRDKGRKTNLGRRMLELDEIEDKI